PLNQQAVDVNERIGESSAIVAEQPAVSDHLRVERVPMDRVDANERELGSSDCVDDHAVVEDDSVWINDEGNVTEKVVPNKRRARRPAYLNLYVSRVYTRDRMFNRAGAMEWPSDDAAVTNANTCSADAGTSISAVKPLATDRPASARNVFETIMPIARSVADVRLISASSVA